MPAAPWNSSAEASQNLSFMPDTAHAEAQQARILDSCLRARGIKPSHRLDPVPVTSNVTIPPPIPPVDGVVPMDVDAISTSRPRPPLLSNAKPSSLPTASPSVPDVVRNILGLSSAEHQQVINSLLLTNDDLDPSTPAAQINALALSFPQSPPRPTPSCPPSPVPRSHSPISSLALIALLGFTPVDEAPRSPVASPPHTPSPASPCTLPHPRPPRSPLRLSSPRIDPPSVVEDDNQPNEGVKTIKNSVLTPETVAQNLMPTKITYYLALFQSRACKNP
ncbi:hypothetical protein EDB92DRAFT_1958725 [Lactarius akahatsu]|uniref:Uncharacterized protein n=1 Tax=Lactarius akahatsu TaxID=416441 RepID=A0AAD4L2F4_9AGAM|nr:hypothetical protein EDB92DRAFT_1958725 [Lactarius akahatsu]